MTKSKERHVPYLLTTSLRKILDLFDSGGFGNYDPKITVLRATAVTSSKEEDQTLTDSQIGLTVEDKSTLRADLDYKGGGLQIDRMKSKLDLLPIHDLSVDRMRIGIEMDKGFKEALKGTWPTLSGKDFKLDPFKIPEQKPLCYLNFEVKNCEDEKLEARTNGGITLKQKFNQLNRCKVCGRPLTVEGFKRFTLNITADGIGIPWINATYPKGKRPILKPHKPGIAPWIYQNIVKPTGYGRMFNFRLGKADQWILKGV